MASVVVALGMHRSGTSLGMSVLAELGIACGRSLVPADRRNPKGFWEHSRIVAVHELLLSSLSRIWHGPEGTHPMPDGWLQSEAAEKAKAQLVDIVAAEVAAASPRVWGFKDPRTARLLPLWMDVFEKAGVRPIYVLLVRHPATVVRSLKRHNGVHEERGQLLWLLHNVDALRWTQGSLRAVVDFDSLVDNPAMQVQRLSRALEGALEVSEDRERSAANVVTDTLRNHAAEGEAIQNTMVKQLYNALKAASEGTLETSALAPVAEICLSAQDLFSPWRQDRQSVLGDWLLRHFVRASYR